jgi:hypothetical protein
MPKIFPQFENSCTFCCDRGTAAIIMMEMEKEHQFANRRERFL